jgi:transcriptional regulator with XRE-family HTH domain
MGSGSTKGNSNVYFNARKEASIYNEKLYSREGAAELLGVSVSALADYELGNTKVVPVDKVVLMADLYHAPNLKTAYCKSECPIGKCMPLATKIEGLEGVALRVIKEFDSDSINNVKKKLIDIAADGEIDESEKDSLEEILKKLDEISLVISEIKLIGEKVLGR